MLQFEWDSQKAASNQRKHRVSFEEATTVFSDHRSITAQDSEHSDDEDRFATIGTSHRLRVLVVIHSDRGDVIRIISARKATANERKAYEEGG